MRLLAPLLSGVAAALALAALTGEMPRIVTRRAPRPAVSDRQVWLLQAGTDLTPRQFVAGSATLGTVTFVLLALVTAAPAVAVVPAVAVGFLPRAWFAKQRAQRLRAVQEAWPDGLRDLLASIGAGMSLHQALESLVRNGPEPLRRAFARYPSLVRMVGVVPALEVIKEELADPTSDRVIEVLILGHERGGHLLGEILADLAEATTRDLRVAEEIATDSLEQKINARAVFVLPWLVLLLLTSREGFFREYYRSPGGLVVVLIGALMSLGGLWIVTHLSREHIERRVLGGSATVSTRDGESVRP